MLYNIIAIVKYIMEHGRLYKHASLSICYAYTTHGSVNMSKTKEMSAEEKLSIALSRIAELEKHASERREKKEFSDYFRDIETPEAKTYKNMSETAKHFEVRAPDVLAELVRLNSGQRISIRDFNAKLVAFAREALF